VSTSTDFMADMLGHGRTLHKLDAVTESHAELLAVIRDLKMGAEMMLQLSGGAPRRYVEEVQRVCALAIKQAQS